MPKSRRSRKSRRSTRKVRRGGYEALDMSGSMPGMPGMPSMPGMPGMPGMPSMPGMPPLPSVDNPVVVSKGGGKKTKRKPSSWNKAVKRVYEEMKRKNRNATFGEAMRVASQRKKNGTL